MKAKLKKAALAGAVLLAIGLGPRPAQADTIAITGGKLDMGTFLGTVSLQGDRGFTLTAIVGVSDSFFAPWTQCFVGCLPGSTINLAANFVGSSLHDATVTLDGQTFTQVGGATSPNSAALTFSGSVMAPPAGGELVTIVAPFLFQGRFTSTLFLMPDGSGSIAEDLTGQGLVTLTLRSFAYPDGPRWNYSAAVYQFDSAPIPEPTTLLLTGAGLAILARRRIRRGGLRQR